MSKYIINKTEAIKKFQTHATDTGSPFVQIAILTERITYLTQHLNEHTKDHDARRSLLIMVAKRKTYLTYVRNKFPTKYQSLIVELKIRDTHKN